MESGKEKEKERGDREEAQRFVCGSEDSSGVCEVKDDHNYHKVRHGVACAVVV